ncbi:MAG TPA: helix-turn-helix domain-containing protein [Spirochaetia bacterium]
MRPDDATTREKILKATVGMLGKHGPEKLTIRQIATEAGVNVAAINYHFRSKENLVDEAVYTFSAEAFAQGMKFLTAAGVAPETRLTNFFRGYAYGLVEFSGATRTAFLGLMHLPGAGGKYAGMVREMLGAARACIGEMTGIADEAELGRRAVMLFSGVAFPFLYLDLFRETSGVDYRNRAERDRYIESLVEVLKTKA